MKNLNIPDCVYFSGYKPCKPNMNCLEEGCKDPKPYGEKILIINLDAMGDVLMTTAQLKAIKRKHPNSSIFWITRKNAVKLLENNPFVDFVLEFNFENVLFLQNIDINVIYNADKSKESCALHKSLKSELKFGFTLNDNGVIIPENDFAHYNFLLGNNDYLKFKVNKKTGQEILAETFNLEYKRDKYVLNLSDEELSVSNSFRKNILNKETDIIIGFNTGCSSLFPNKKMTIEQHSYLIEKLLNNPNYRIVLLGGPEDTERNKEINKLFNSQIYNSPTEDGLRKGLCYINSCDIVVTGDTFGMHAAIALNKYVIAWFGLSCWEEIDLYDNGKKFFPTDLHCSPCWKKSCPYNLECIQSIDLDGIINAINSFYNEYIINKK